LFLHFAREKEVKEGLESSIERGQIGPLVLVTVLKEREGEREREG
jgi:hypothetical protein